MNIFRKILIVSLSLFIHVHLEGACLPKKCIRGPKGPPGPPGTSQIEHLYTYNTFSTDLAPIPAGDFVPFVGTIKGAGSSIAKDPIDPFLFTITKAGNYLVNVVGYVTPGNQGGLRLLVNGSATDNPGTPPTFDNTPITHQQVIFVDVVPATLHVQVTGTQLEFFPDASATIVITQLSLTS